MLIYTPGLWLFILSAFVISGLMLYSWQYRKSEIGRYFLFLMGCALIWVAFFTFETAATSLQAKLFFVVLEFIGIAFLPVAWVFIVFTFTGQLLPRHARRILFLLPSLTTLIIWTNPLHHWFIGQPYIITQQVPFPILYLDYQFWFYAIHAPTGYIYILFSLYFLIKYMLKTEPIYKVQARMLLSAILLPSITDVLYVLGISPVKYYNYTTAMFSISGLLLIWTLFHFRFIDLLPLARDKIIDNLTDGIIVIDHKQRIVYINPSAKQAFQLPADIIGQPIKQVNHTCIQQINDMLERKKTSMDVVTGTENDQYFDLRLSPVFNQNGFQIGHVASMYDVTHRVQQYNQVHTLSIQDGLTGIFNRRHFLDICNRELDRIQTNDAGSAAVVMIDLDEFKLINDRFGHAAGDKMLVAFAEIIQSTLRKYDFFGRLGGDEFGLFLNNISIKEAQEVIMRVRKKVAALCLATDNNEISVTASFGIVHTQQIDPAEMNIEAMLQLADQALYQGKEAGKNYIQFYTREL